MGIDYGMKRTGISVTDPLQLIVTGLDTVETPELPTFIEQYFKQEEVEKVVFGLPTHADGNPTHLTPVIQKFAKQLQNLFPAVEIDFQDEAYTSKKAKEILLHSGVSKKKRRDKSKVDRISAVLILQAYLHHI